MRVRVEHDDRKGQQIRGVGRGEGGRAVGAVARGERLDDAVDLLRLAREAEAGEEAAEGRVEGEAGEGGLRGDVGVEDLGGWWVGVGGEYGFGMRVRGR